jgi:hypothetical protein
MVRTTERPSHWLYPLARAARLAGIAALVGMICIALLATAGCSKGSQTAGTSAASSEATNTMSAHMAGPPVDVHIAQSVVDAVPAHWNLTTPESTVRSYLAWVTYADRIGQSAAATPTMSASEEVGVDSYIQYYLEKSRLIDQKLTSITFGSPSTGSTSTLVPTKEAWTYSYLSVAEGNAVLEGPYTASYDVTYTVVKQPGGTWVVDSVAAKSKGKVK